MRPRRKEMERERERHAWCCGVQWGYLGCAEPPVRKPCVMPSAPSPHHSTTREHFFVKRIRVCVYECVFRIRARERAHTNTHQHQHTIKTHTRIHTTYSIVVSFWHSRFGIDYPKYRVFRRPTTRPLRQHYEYSRLDRSLAAS